MVSTDQINQILRTAYGSIESIDVIQTVGNLDFQQQNSRGTAMHWQRVSSPASSPRSLLQFVGALQLEIPDALAGVAIGIFDGQTYAWVFVRKFDVDLTRRIYDIKAAVEQDALGWFEVHVEPIEAGSRVEDLIPTGYTLVRFEEQPWQRTMST